MNHVYFLYTNILWNNGCLQTKKSTDFLNNVSWNPEVVDVSKANTINGFKYGKFVYVTGEFWILDTFTNTWTGEIILYNTPRAMHIGQKIETQTNNMSFSGFLPTINASDVECFSIYIRETPINGLAIQFGGLYISE